MNYWEDVRKSKIHPGIYMISIFWGGGPDASYTWVQYIEDDYSFPVTAIRTSQYLYDKESIWEELVPLADDLTSKLKLKMQEAERGSK